MAEKVDEVGNSNSTKICYDDDSDENEKARGHTFRQRRLTYSTQHLKEAAAAAAAAAAALTDPSDDDDDGDEENPTQINLNVNARESEKRKLLHDNDPGATQVEEGTSSNDLVKKQRTDETQDDGGSGSKCDIWNEVHEHEDEDENQNESSHERSKVLHASAPPQPTCPMRRSSILYRHPPRETDAHGAMALIMADDEASANDLAACAGAGATTVPGIGGGGMITGPIGGSLRPYSELVEPEWKKSHQFHHSLKDRALPFPRDTVGTYSCHGIEPVYGSDPGDDPNPTITAIAKINQDRGGIAVSSTSSRTAIFAAYDGHGEGGELVSQYALHEIPKRLEEHEDFKKGNYEKAFTDVFVSVNADLGNERDIEPLYSGCTACVALVKGDVLYLSNAGDSRAVLACRKSSDTNVNGVDLEREDSSHIQYEAYDLTKDQNPDSPGEQERIERLGGFVSPPPEEGLSARVWLDAGYSQIGLAMARSLGDHAVKSIGVIAEPVVTRHELRAQDEFMIIATDGVWEFLSSQEAVDIVSKDLNSDGGSSLACQNLIEAAAAKWHQYEGDYRDDITAIIIKIKELWD